MIYPNVDVIYDSVIREWQTSPRHRRETAEHKTEAAGDFPGRLVELRFGRSASRDQGQHRTSFCAGWHRCPVFVLFKIDKEGCGDSEGDCSQNDFDSELAGYRAAFRALKNYGFIDTNRVYISGSSNGGGFAPLVPETEAEQAEVRGYIYDRRLG